MTKILTFTVLAIVMLSFKAPNHFQSPSETNKSLTKFFDDYYEEYLKMNPLQATSQGDNRYNDQLPINISPENIAQTKAFFSKNLIAIQKFDRSKLSDEEKVAYDIFKREMEIQLKGFQFHEEYIPFSQFGGLPLSLGQLGSGDGNQPFKTVQDYDNWLKRVSQFKVWGDVAITNFRKGIAAGVVLPKSLVIKMIPQMNSFVVADASKSLFYGPINKLPASFSDADKTRLTEAYKKMIADEIVPTYKKLSTFLKEEYLPKSRTSSGIGSLPNGAAHYTYRAEVSTTTTKTPEEIYQIGLKEVDRIHGEMEKVKAQVGFKGSLNDFFTYLNTDKKFYPYKTPEEVLADFNKILTKIEPNLKKLFNKTPKTKFEIRETEKFREASAAAQYNRGSADGSRPGIFYVPIPDATKYATSGMESLFAHEAIPGHHYQVSLQQENTAINKFQRFSFYSAYGEGWGLYCESLGKELGLYADPYQQMGALGNEIHRAIRLVVDVGLHAKNMSREEAIKYMMDNEPISEQKATAEIERYMANAGQALSYKIGELKIKELRAKYEKQLGTKFNIASFHDEFLKDGGMPLSVLERKMDAWAKRQ